MNAKWLKLFVRNFKRNFRLHAFNISGLSLGVSAALLVTLYVQHEFSYDRFHDSHTSIYRMEAKTGSDFWVANLGVEHTRELLNGSYPEVEGVAYFTNPGRAFVYHNGERFVEDNVYQTSSSNDFFDFFDFEFQLGDPSSALNGPNRAVISRSTAEKYFGDESPIGEVLNYDSTLLEITGVIKDIPTHTHLDFDIIYTNPTYSEDGHFHVQNYIMLSPNASPMELESKILNMDGVAYNEFHELDEVRLLPLRNIYLDSDASFGAGGSGDKLQIYSFLILSGLVLLISVINYVNLTYVVFLHKGKEIGIRKILGESRSNLVLGMASQSVLVALLAAPPIAVILYFLIPMVGTYLSVDLSNILWENIWYLPLTFVILVATGLMTIIYPAIAMKSMNVASMIKKKMLLNKSDGVRYRNFLMTTQFILLFTLGLSAWFVFRQIDYLDNKDKGFKTENVLKLEYAFDIGSYDDYVNFKNKLLSYPIIEGVSFGPTMGDGMTPLSYKVEGSDDIKEDLLSYGVDIDYFDVMQIPILKGEFKGMLENASPGKIVSLVNQSFVDHYEWNEDPIGRKIVLRPGTENELNRQVSAVFNDFHFYSFKEMIAPQIISLRPDPQFVNTNILIRYGDKADHSRVKTVVESEWNRIQPDFPVSIVGMEDTIRELYWKERQTSRVGLVLSLLAILLSLMGLVGFIIYLLGLKSKEIAIRRVLGSSTTQIISLIHRQFTPPVLLSGVVGSLVSYWMMSNWLKDYAYAILINPLTFIIAVLIVLFIVFWIIAIQSRLKIESNPMEVLSDGTD